MAEGDLVPTQMKCFLKCFVSAMECLYIWATSHNTLSIILLCWLRFVWNAHRFEIGQNGQNGQNGHSLDSEGDFVPTQMKRFLKCLVQSLESLCIWATSHIPFRITLLWLRLVWNARRIEVGQNGQNGHSLDSDLIELIPTLKVVIHNNALSVGLGMPMYMGHFA